MFHDSLLLRRPGQSDAVPYCILHKAALFDHLHIPFVFLAFIYVIILQQTILVTKCEFIVRLQAYRE